MKKAAYISATILEILCLAGAWAVQFFTRTKMGMARYVVYKNRGWESRYPMELLAKGAALVMVLLTAMLLLCFLRRRRNLTKELWVMSAGMVLLTSGYAVFTWMNSTNEFRAYYFISAILGAVSLIQCIKTWMGMLGCRQEGSGALFLPCPDRERKQRVQRLCLFLGNMPGIPECDEKPDMGKSMVNRMLTKFW